MEISRIQPNCSEVALVVYPDKLNKKQKDFFDRFIKDRDLEITKTPLGNWSIETGIGHNPDYKDGLWGLKEEIEAISKHNKLFIFEDKHYGLVRGESYYDMIEEKRL